MQVSCPLAPYTTKHKNNVDRKPSMGILPRDNDGCLVHCFTCGWKSASIKALVEHMAGFNEEFAQYIEEANKIEEVDLDQLLDDCEIYGMRGAEKPKGPPYKVYPDVKIAPFSRLYHPYLGRRGISKATGRRWELGFDTQQRRVVIPVRDRQKRLVGAVGRTITPHGKPKYLNYWKFDKANFLLGEHLADRTKRTVLVEGALDAPAAWQGLGRLRPEYDVVASMGAQLSEKQLDRLVEISTEVVLAFDNDPAGLRARQFYGDKLSGRILIRTVSWQGTEFTDPADAGDAFADLVERATMIF